MTEWFTSDPHKGHRLVSQLRGFATVDEHDETLAANWRRVVRPEDSVWLCGDLAVNHYEDALEWVRSLPGTKHLIVGNHDPCHPMHRDAHKWQGRYLTAFASVQAFARRRINFNGQRQDVLLSHFPYSSDHTEHARYLQYRLRDEGAWLMHGHTHGVERLHGREIHVGLDAWAFTPVPLGIIIELMQQPVRAPTDC